jgi:hypothetical protein
MTASPSSPDSNQSTPTPKSSWRPIVITLCSALLLGAGSCFGFLMTLNSNGGSSAANTTFMIGFFLCLVAFLAGLAWAFATGIRNAKRKG